MHPIMNDQNQGHVFTNSSTPSASIPRALTQRTKLPPTPHVAPLCKHLMRDADLCKVQNVSGRFLAHNTQKKLTHTHIPAEPSNSISRPAYGQYIVPEICEKEVPTGTVMDARPVMPSAKCHSGMSRTAAYANFIGRTCEMDSLLVIWDLFVQNPGTHPRRLGGQIIVLSLASGVSVKCRSGTSF